MPISSKFNKKHDQLMITSFNDGSLGLYRVSSVSSAPISTQSAQRQFFLIKKKQLTFQYIYIYIYREEDGLIKIYDEHENTVYSVAWSSCSAWNFASISYYGSVIVNVVPSLVKHRILY
ncbi:tumor suppressing subtransferable candidate 1, putative [Ichthyophthirius multifiliis]|uniref:Tumor suppressing subtransferable candidate 1, putative n=1 Tax=Ichthyophthirius multifiliis TaxID=5932 RepID=G0QL71_ICHMU|nr:tumor suppressing subtransferable candidate 1, putative [Ichthyophthirius multifiliis]EGR34032.1 tumor suppressing subtransferable candidate 1, putative [Ichthyophthirius multifiliis]|eukprot:XP_004039336.1 tumor suppressing subtransferable candidate 1, putative [Ichthyophthirius multifiliis]